MFERVLKAALMLLAIAVALAFADAYIALRQLDTSDVGDVP